MTERERPDPPDEIIIGGTAAGAPVIGDYAAGRSDRRAPARGGEATPDDGYDGFDGIGYDDGAYDEYYDDEYYDEPPARQPLFYIFIGLAVLLGAVLVFLLFRLLSDEGSPSPAVDLDFNIQIDSPLNDERVNAGDDVVVRIRANATEPLRALQLLLEGQVVDEARFDAIPADGIYAATLSLRIDQPGNYQVSARAISAAGASLDSSVVRIIAVERIDTPPSRITGEVISTVNARQGPGDQYTALRTLNAGQIITVIGRTRDNQWLLLDDDTWIRRAAVQLSDSIDLVEVRQPTPTQALPTNTPEPSPSPSPSPNADAPDFTPTNATLDSGGSILRVTVANLSSHPYQGPLVVRVTGIGTNAIEQVFSVSIGANNTQSVEFTLPQSQPSGATVKVAVDASGQVNETSEDNNAASFVLAPPVSSPEILITGASILNNTTIRVTIMNVGSDMPASRIDVTVELGGEANTASRAALALAFGDSEIFTITRPDGSGLASITVSVGGEELATGSIEIPGANTPGPTASATP